MAQAEIINPTYSEKISRRDFLTNTLQEYGLDAASGFFALLAIGNLGALHTILEKNYQHAYHHDLPEVGVRSVPAEGNHTTLPYTYTNTDEHNRDRITRRFFLNFGLSSLSEYVSAIVHAQS